MKSCSKCGESKPHPSFYSDARKSDGVDSQCKECRKSTRRSGYALDPSKDKAFCSAWRVKNKEHISKYNAMWRKENLAEHRENCAEWKIKNKDKISAYNAQYSRDNYSEMLARGAARHARKMQAFPQWANRFYIQEIYDLAVRRTQALGIPHDVDHIVPLISPLVCGLHVEANLRVIPATENRSKSNKWWPGMSVVELPTIQRIA